MKFDIDINPSYEDISVVIKSPDMNAEVTGIMTKLQTDTVQQETISGRIDQKIFVLDPKDILLFYSENGKVMADTMEASYEIKQKLYAVEESLKQSTFIRISKSAIVNVKRIKNIEMFFNGSLVVKFHNGHEEIISRRYVAKVKEFIGMGGK